MKSKTEIAAVFYVVLGALKAAKGSLLNGVPNGHLYAELMGMMDLDEWNRILIVLKSNGHITESNYLLCITPKGEELHTALDTIYAEAKAKQEAK